MDVVGEIVTDFTGFDLNVFRPKKDKQYGRIYDLRFQIKAIFGAKDGILKFQTESKGKVMGKTDIKFAGK